MVLGGGVTETAMSVMLEKYLKEEPDGRKQLAMKACTEASQYISHILYITDNMTV